MLAEDKVLIKEIEETVRKDGIILDMNKKKELKGMGCILKVICE